MLPDAVHEKIREAWRDDGMISGQGEVIQQSHLSHLRLMSFVSNFFKRLGRLMDESPHLLRRSLPPLASATNEDSPKNAPPAVQNASRQSDEYASI